MKTRCAKIYLPTQRTNWQILTNTKKIRFWPSTHGIDAASFVKIASNSWKAEVIARSTRYQTLWTDKNLARNHSTTKLVLSGQSRPSIRLELLSPSTPPSANPFGRQPLHWDGFIHQSHAAAKGQTAPPWGWCLLDGRCCSQQSKCTIPSYEKLR